MKLLLSTASLVHATHCCNVLQAAGIRFEVMLRCYGELHERSSIFRP